MIINLMGLSGAGKSTAVRALISKLGDPTKKILLNSWRKPLALEWHSVRWTENGALCVLGHYESNLGSCDYLQHSMDLVFQLVRQYATSGFDVVFEGGATDTMTHAERLASLFRDGLGLHVLHVDVTPEVALRGVQARNEAAGKNPSKVAKLESRYKQRVRQEKVVQRLIMHSVPYTRVRRDTVLPHLLSLLELPSASESGILGNVEEA